MEENKKKPIPTEEEISREDYTWDLGEINPAVVSGQAVSPVQGQAVVQNPAPAPKIRYNSVPRVIPEVGKAVVQNPTDAPQYKNVSEIIRDVELVQGDDTERKRTSDAYRYISGLGDTISSLANLVGTANGASNQEQRYNSPEIVKKIEEERKRRDLTIQKIKERQQEMQEQKRIRQQARSLEELKLKMQQEARAEEARRFDATQAYNAKRDARADFVADRAYEAQREDRKTANTQWRKTYEQTLAQFNEQQKEKQIPIVQKNGATVSIPKAMINDVNIAELFKQLPPEVQKEVRGDAYSEKVGEATITKYKPATAAQRFSAAMAYLGNPSADPERVKNIEGILNSWVASEWNQYIRK